MVVLKNTPLNNFSERFVFAGILALLIALPIPAGGNSTFAVSMFGFVVNALASLWILMAALGGVHSITINRTLRLALVLWMGWLCVITIQLIPLPEQILRILSPSAARLHTDINALSLSQDWHCISIMPGATITQLILSVDYFVLYVLTVLTTRTVARIRWILGTILISGLVQTLIALYAILNPDLAGGAHSYATPASGTFVNRNHFAAYLELSCAAALGLILSDLRMWQVTGWKAVMSELISLLLSRKLVIRVMLLTMVIGLVLSRSRMGNTAFYSSLCLSGALFVALRDRRWLMWSLPLFGSVLLLDVWIVSNYFGLDVVIDRIQETRIAHEERFIVLSDLTPVASNYWLSGAGLGTFAQAFSPDRPEALINFYNHAHNEYAEFLIETGVLGCGFLGLLMLTHLGRALYIIRHRKHPIYAAVAFSGLCAMTAIMIHMSVEFMLRIPAVSATLLVLMALVTAIPDQEPRKSKTT